MSEINEMTMEEMIRRFRELRDEAVDAGYDPRANEEPTEEEKLRVHYTSSRPDVNTEGTFNAEDFALLGNLKRYRASAVNIPKEADRDYYNTLLDGAYFFYSSYAGMAEIKKQTVFLSEWPKKKNLSESFLVRLQALLLDSESAIQKYRGYAQELERYFRLVTAKVGEESREDFKTRLLSEEDFPLPLRSVLETFEVSWDEAAEFGAGIHMTPPTLTYAMMVVDGYGKEQADCFLKKEGSDRGFSVDDPYAVTFAVSNFDNAMQPLFTTAQIRTLREQKKSMYDMIFVEGTNAKELYGGLISKDLDAKKRGSEMKMRIFADILHGKKVEISNGEKYLPLLLRVDMEALQDRVESTEPEDLSLDEFFFASSREMVEWVDRMAEKLWGVIDEALEEHPEGIEDAEEIQKWLDGVFDDEE